MKIDEWDLSKPPAIVDEDSYYPHSDGKPLGESHIHLVSVMEMFAGIIDLLEDRLNELSVHSDMFWYWERGNPQAARAPDLMVIPGVPMDPMRVSYLGWNHGDIVPNLIIESASQQQQHMLLGELRDDYERLGVQEYFIFDSAERYMPEPLMGFRLRNGRYQRIRPGDAGTLASLQLGVRFRPERGRLRLVNSRTGEPILTRLEKLAVANKTIAAKDEAIVAKDEAIVAKDEAIAAKDEAIAAANKVIAAKDEAIAAAQESVAAAQESVAAKNQELQRMRELLKQAGITPPETP